MNIVIIGASTSGLACAQHIRRASESARITILERSCVFPSQSRAVEALSMGTTATAHTRTDDLQARSAIDLKLGHEVSQINRRKKELTVFDHQAACEYTMEYDYLVLAGGTQTILPESKGVHDKRVYSAYDAHDMVEAHEMIAKHKGTDPLHACVIGAGATGLAACDSLIKLGCKISLFDAGWSCLPGLDFDLALHVHQELEDADVSYYLGSEVSGFATKKGLAVVDQQGNRLGCDLVILATGTQADSQLAAASGLEVHEHGTVDVDEGLLTSDDYIFACGGLVDTQHALSMSLQYLPSEALSEKQGKLIAEQIVDAPSAALESLATHTAQCGRLNCAWIGLSQSDIANSGCDSDAWDSITLSYTSATSHTSVVRYIYQTEDGALLGAQAVSRDSLDTWLATTEALLQEAADIWALTRLGVEPFERATDHPSFISQLTDQIQAQTQDGFFACSFDADMTEFGAGNSKEGYYSTATLIDVSETDEFVAFSVPGALNLPTSGLRRRNRAELLELMELEPEDLKNGNYQLILFSSCGARAREAAYYFRNLGFTNILLYPGGSYHYRHVLKQYYQ